jgi:hypothetical protein
MVWAAYLQHGLDGFWLYYMNGMSVRIKWILSRAEDMRGDIHLGLGGSYLGK